LSSVWSWDSLTIQRKFSFLSLTKTVVGVNSLAENSSTSHESPHVDHGDFLGDSIWQLLLAKLSCSWFSQINNWHEVTDADLV